ncbi:MAG TPA: VanW family protein [Actinophytocola sp.]|uniref:VanW family protein n=1 Tax=Actinophytocola sp. TaxID=1872138 RepID=UPI002DDD4998|nr:VanW family protein [Actinophytocola sp.]HEV2782266.1 VanW family protein [Actinophytocola sp.]
MLTDDVGAGQDQKADRDWTISWRVRRILLIAAGVLAAAGLLYGIDLALSAGDLPRGVVIAGVDVGGLSRADAERALREVVEPRLGAPATVLAADVDATVDPADGAVTVDWPATLDRAGSQPVNPLARLTSLFTHRPVGLVAHGNDPAIRARLETLRARVDRAPLEGTVRFYGTTVVPIEPLAGRRLDADAATGIVVAEWGTGQPIHLPVTELPAQSTVDGVRAALERIARPAISSPVTVRGEGREAALTPEAIAGALTFVPADGGGLAARLDKQKLVDALGPALAATERAGTDARIVIEGDAPVVKPSVDGRRVDWDGLAGQLPEVLARTDNRVLAAPYRVEPPAMTTEAAGRLGVKEIIGEFTTRGFARDSGVNIKVVAEKVQGALVMPGETFSLNGFTGPRGPEQGYIEAGVIEDGVPARAVGGGISQFATTLYNAAYFAAMTDVEHKEHSFYISRYPPAREATVFQNPDGSSVLDLKFRNDAPTAAVIQTIWTPETITIRLWGTKHQTVESITGPRTGFVSPPSRRPAPGEPCVPSRGSSGFTTSDTRVIRDLAGNEISRTTRTVVYNPSPRIICAGG